MKDGDFMIKSMTGYGSAKGISEKLGISIELKSVNNRFLDCSVRIPRSYSFAEEAVKKLVKERIARGKVDIFINIDSSNADDIELKVNKPLIEAYINALGHISEQYNIKNDLSVVSLSRYPDVFTLEKKEIDADEFTNNVCCILKEAIDQYDKMRETEGERLCDDISAHLDTIEGLKNEIEKRSPETVSEYQRRLEKKMQDILESTTIDTARILTEAAIFADKIAVDEETTRLASHIEQVRGLLKGSGAVGRKLDFLIQEMNRETNTIGSKCNNLEITHMVVEIKAEIEKIREQVQNIE